jgi:LPXTG-motif cell wall-anchored protein
MLAMVLAAAVPALAQSVTQVGSGNQACVQTAVQAEVGKVQISQYGDNVNIQSISQQCNVTAAQVNTVVASVSSASATAAPAAQYQYKAPAAAQYQYSASPAAASPAAELPETGGSSLIALGAGVLLVAGGLLARRIVR